MSIKSYVKVITPSSTVASSKSKGEFIGNMEWRGGGWQTRLGFGQLCEYDSTLSQPVDSSTSTMGGYLEQLGSALIRTDFQHEQIVSILKANVQLGSADYRGTSVNTVYVISIYDITTDSRWEEVVTKKTEEVDPSTLAMPDQHGYHKSYALRSWGEPKSVVQGDPVFFVEFGGRLYFGNKDLGLLCYLPSIFSRDRSNFGVERRQAQIENQLLSHESAPVHDESSIVVQIVATDGVVTADFSDDLSTYVDTSAFPQPVAACVMQGRMVYVDSNHRTIWFSDVNHPQSIQDTNTIEVDSALPVTAVAELSGDLYIWTSSETWVYRPSLGNLASGGRGPIRISDRIGCASPRLVVKDPKGLMWVDSNGVHATLGNMEVHTLSDDIRELWADHVTNPVTSFYSGAYDGAADILANNQPTTVIRWDETGANAVYAPSLDALLVSIPSSHLVLYLSKGHWSFWNLESVCADDGGGTPVPIVKAIRNITNAQLLVTDKDMYLVGGMDEQAISNALESGPNAAVDYTFSAYYVLEYGRGGAVDRSVWDEDDRTLAGMWHRTNLAGTDGYVYVGKPIYLPPGWEFWVGGPTASTNEDQPDVLIPIHLMVTGIAGEVELTDLNIEFTFDDLNFVPVFRSGTEIAFLVPPERFATASGFGGGAANPGVAEVQCYINGGAASVLGDTVVIWWTGATSAFLNPRVQNPIIYIPFRRSSKLGLTGHTSGRGFAGDVAAATDANVGALGFDFMCWEEATRGDDGRVDDSVVQSIDWVCKSGIIEAPGQQTLLRDVWARVCTHGTGDNPIVPGWPWRVLNLYMGTDFKLWCAQIIDHSDPLVDPKIQVIVDKSGLRARVWDGAFELLREKRFGVQNVEWGDATDYDDGTFIMGDEEVQDTNFTAALEGGWVSVMFAGHLMDRAEGIRIEEVTVDYLGIGQRVRIGMPGQATPLSIPKAP